MLERAIRVPDVRDAAAHACAEVAPGRAEHDDATAGHVLAAVVADALDHCVRVRVAHGEALAAEAADVGLAAGGPVERDVADDHILLWRIRHALRRDDDHASARESFGEVVVGVAFEAERRSGRQPRGEALSRGALEGEADGVVREARAAVPPDDLPLIIVPTTRFALRILTVRSTGSIRSIADSATAISSWSSAASSPWSCSSQW